MMKILPVAQQCSYKGGTAVYRARVLADLFNNNVWFYNDFNICASQGIYREKANSFKKNLRVKLIPNPASEKVEIIISGIETGICNIVLKNKLAQELMILEFNCERNSHYLDVSTLVPGIYTVGISINNEFISIEKLVIVR